jgi:hypothetical protein
MRSCLRLKSVVVVTVVAGDEKYGRFNFYI